MTRSTVVVIMQHGGGDDDDAVVVVVAAVVVQHCMERTEINKASTRTYHHYFSTA